MFDTEMPLEDAKDFLREIEGLKRHQGVKYTADAIATVLYCLEQSQREVRALKSELNEIARSQQATKKEEEK